MSIVPAICTQCRAALKIDPEAEVVVCEYCRTSFIVKQLLNQGVTPNQNVRQAPEQDDRDAFEIIGSTLVKYRGNNKDVVIPFGVTEIARGAFKFNHRVTSIEIPASVKKIGQRYNNYRFRDIFIMGPFVGCRYLRRVNIPDSVIEIEPLAFSKSEILQEIIISDNALARLGSDLLEAFQGTNPILIEDLKRRIVAAGGSIEK